MKRGARAVMRDLAGTVAAVDGWGVSCWRAIRLTSAEHYR